MPQSLVMLPVHIVFSTKDHKTYIDNAIAPRLHAYLADTCNAQHCMAIRVGGMDDHVHILATMSRTASIGGLVEEVKKRSSKWIKTLGADYGEFYWQRGYGAFCVGIDRIDAVDRYISNQAEHHKKRSFKDEFRALLKKYNIDYDERYVWD